jgi:hypothetical protein
VLGEEREREKERGRISNGGTTDQRPTTHTESRRKGKMHREGEQEESTDFFLIAYRICEHFV